MAQCITAIRTASSSWHSAAKVLLPTPAAGSAQSAAIFCQSPLHRLKTYKKPQLYFSGCQQWQYGDLKAHHLGHHVSGLVESRKSSVSKNLIIHQPHQSRHHKLNSHPVVASGLSTDIQHQGSNDDLSGYLQRVADCNVGQERIKGSEFLELRGNGSLYGYVHQTFAEQLLPFSNTFHVKTVPSEDASPEEHSIELNQSLKTDEARTNAVAAVCSELRKKGVITGWRDELYPVTTSFHDEPYFGLERAAAPHFGITAYGVHLNGYTEDADGNIHLWVARRSAKKQTWPLRLDHLVAGGQPLGLGCADNLVKECQEEAGIRPELARRATPAGLVSYEMVTTENRVKRDVLFVYDLKLPFDFQPKNEDGEVESFELWPLARVAETIRTTEEYKPNVALVIIDFLIRCGYIHPDQRGYVELVSSLRTGCVEPPSQRTT